MTHSPEHHKHVGEAVAVSAIERRRPCLAPLLAQTLRLIAADDLHGHGGVAHTHCTMTSA